MGSYTIVISGTGPHHNGRADVVDADRVAREAVEQLRAGGHTVAAAAITFGVTEQLGANATHAVQAAAHACAGAYVVLRLEDGSEAVMTDKQLAALG